MKAQSPGGASEQQEAVRVTGDLAWGSWLVIRVVGIAANRPSARTITRSTREQTPGGGEKRTIHTTTRR